MEKEIGIQYKEHLSFEQGSVLVLTDGREISVNGIYRFKIRRSPAFPAKNFTENTMARVTAIKTLPGGIFQITLESQPPFSSLQIVSIEEDGWGETAPVARCR